MEQHVLVPYDGSPAARSAVEYARDRFSSARITLLYVMDPMADYSRRQSFPGYTHADEYKNERGKGEYLLETIVDELPDGAPVDTEITAGNPARSIIGYADDNDVGQIVIGSHGREAVARFLLGSVAEAVIRRSAVPVTVVRPSEERT